jgi:hypothetical protein
VAVVTATAEDRAAPQHPVQRLKRRSLQQEQRRKSC